MRALLLTAACLLFSAHAEAQYKPAPDGSVGWYIHNNHDGGCLPMGSVGMPFTTPEQMVLQNSSNVVAIETFDNHGKVERITVKTEEGTRVPISFYSSYTQCMILSKD